MAATTDYFIDEDIVGLWLAERIRKETPEERKQNPKGEPNFLSSKALYQDWRDWIEASGEGPGTQRQFTETLQSKNYKFVRRNNGRGLVGFRISYREADA